MDTPLVPRVIPARKEHDTWEVSLTDRHLEAAVTAYLKAIGLTPPEGVIAITTNERRYDSTDRAFSALTYRVFYGGDPRVEL